MDVGEEGRDQWELEGGENAMLWRGGAYGTSSLMWRKRPGPRWVRGKTKSRNNDMYFIKPLAVPRADIPVTKLIQKQN